jgi:hypothetical protein
VNRFQGSETGFVTNESGNDQLALDEFSQRRRFVFRAANQARDEFG